MGLINRNGKKLTENDVRALRKIYKDLLEGYLKVIAADENATLETQFEDPGAQKYIEQCNQFLTQYDEAGRSEEDTVVEDFYNNGFLNLYNGWPRKKASCGGGSSNDV